MGQIDYELLQLIGGMLDDRFRYFASKEDLLALHADIRETRDTLRRHIEEQESHKKNILGLKMLAAGAVITSLVSTGLKWIF